MRYVQNLPRHGLAAVTLPAGILAAGGGVIQGLSATSSVDQFVPGLPAGDINSSGSANAVDVQLVINAALDIDIAPLNADIDGDGDVGALDVQRAINAALGL